MNTEKSLLRRFGKIAVIRYCAIVGVRLNRATARFVLDKGIEGVAQLLRTSVPSGTKKNDRLWSAMADLRDALKRSGFDPDKHHFLVTPI